jgi:hypothetical protein
MQIYDCFTFYNEFDLLEIRLAELYNTVDHFVLVEANQTFTNRPKPYLFEENQARYSQYLDKIIHVKVEMPSSNDPWVNETHQRNAIMEGVKDAQPDDIIIISDCDEVLRASAINQMRTTSGEVFSLRMPLFNFKFNYMRTTPGEYDAWAMAARKQVMDNNSPNVLRNQRFNPYQFTIIEHAGWHFGYLGNREFLVDKAKSFSHQEVNRPEFIEQIDIEASIRERKEWDRSQPAKYEIVELDSYFPVALLNNKEKYQQYILDNPVMNALAILPSYPYNN